MRKILKSGARKVVSAHNRDRSFARKIATIEMKQFNFASVAVVVSLAILIPLEKQTLFTYGFHSTYTVNASTKPTICIPEQSRARTIPPLVLSASNSGYGRGADIWPESNNDAVKLSDSFPSGIVPYAAAVAFEQPEESEDPSKKRPTYIQRILKRAASKDESGKSSVSKIPIAVALVLVVRGMVRPFDVGLVSCWTAYFTILNMTAQSLRDSGAPMLPAVPPQGHVPAILSNPLGITFENSSTYRRWLKLGALLGFVGPLFWLLGATRRGLEKEAAILVGRPLFLMCCQMITEGIAKQNKIPLPLRVLVPIVYNATRLIYLWQWAFSSSTLGRIGKGLGIANAAYWALNLFAFLIPIASIRYMRAHFFGVEAEEVTTRIGLEETVGIVPNNIGTDL